MSTKHISHSLSDTREIAENFAHTLAPGDVVAFVGEMGAGKTAFTRCALAALGIIDRVQSPTFAIVNAYKTPAGTDVCHFDMYRVSSADELDTTGYYDYLDSGDGILFVEWSENITESIPSTARYVKIKTISETEREIEIC
jgi:ATPase, YjeE family